MLNLVKKCGVSKSKWVTELIREKMTHTWPENIVGLAGTWKNMSTTEEIRKTMGSDADRESK
jgi:hypothetical protein